jgi:hypothetical protein
MFRGILIFGLLLLVLCIVIHNLEKKNMALGYCSLYILVLDLIIMTMTVVAFVA